MSSKACRMKDEEKNETTNEEVVQEGFWRLSHIVCHLNGPVLDKVVLTTNSKL